MAYIGADSYKWQLPEEEKMLKYALDNENATYLSQKVCLK